MDENKEAVMVDEIKEESIKEEPKDLFDSIDFVESFKALEENEGVTDTVVILRPDRVLNEFGLTINQKIIPFGTKWIKNYGNFKIGDLYKEDAYMKTLSGITIHNTNKAYTSNDAELYTRATYNQNMRTARVHYYVDEVNAWQNLEDKEIGWHAGDGYGPGNTTTISIEIIMDNSGSEASKKALENGVLLTAILMRRHKLTIDQIFTHQKFSGKYCPRYILDGIGWNAFLDMVQAKYKEITAKDEPEYIESEDGLYHTIENVPLWARDIVNKWIEDGIITGASEKLDLNMSHEMLRTLIIANRMVEKYK